jgi:hypothetical protein
MLAAIVRITTRVFEFSLKLPTGMDGQLCSGWSRSPPMGELARRP